MILMLIAVAKYVLMYCMDDENKNCKKQKQHYETKGKKKPQKGN